MIDELQFEKLDTIDAVIRKRCTEITHITVHEVLDRSGYLRLSTTYRPQTPDGPSVDLVEAA